MRRRGNARARKTAKRVAQFTGERGCAGTPNLVLLPGDEPREFASVLLKRACTRMSCGEAESGSNSLASPAVVLEMLLENPGDLISGDELHARLWPADTFVSFDHGT